VIAHNLGNLWRRLQHPWSVESLCLTSLQQRLVKTGGRQMKHARHYRLLLAERVAAVSLDSPFARDTRRLLGGVVCDAFELSPL
jgi:hypothetical protein